MGNAILNLMEPRSIAVIGASTDPKKTAGRPIAYLQKHHFKGKIYPVNPRVEEIAGLKCYPDISSLPETPDVAIIMVGTDKALSAVQELSQLGTPAAIVLTSGFAEHGPEGLKKQEELIAAAGAMRILGPNTIGMVNVTDDIPLSPSSALEMDEFPKGGVSVISQSGGILGSLLSRAAASGLGLSKLVSTSNEADLGMADFVDYLTDDPSTKVIVLYIESIRHPEKFRAAALRARLAGKPIVVYKVGKSEAGIKAAVSHTGALAGSDKMYDALFKQTGIIRANKFSDFLDIPAALSSGRVLKGKRVAILTSTGGAGTLVADSLGEWGFETPVPDEKTAERLRALQSGDQAVLDRNPIDVTLAGLQPDLLRGAISALLDSPSYDALILILGSSSLSMPDLMASAVRDCMQSSDKPVIAYVSPHAPIAGALMTKLGVPAFSQPESCSVALSSMLHASGLRGVIAQTGAVATMPVGLDIASLHGLLNEYQAKNLFSTFDIPGVREVVVDAANPNLESLKGLGDKCVLKILSNEITHKTEVGGVALNIAITDIPSKLLTMAAEVKTNSGSSIKEFLVQEMAAGGQELMVGMHQDPLGTAILVGMGGVTAELFKDTSMRLISPGKALSKEEVLEMLQELKTWPLLNGYRGRVQCDLNALVKAIVQFSEMVAVLGERLIECEINPIFVFAQGQGVKAADGIAVLT
ncbi:acetate--CoA ligase family protein [Polynucleobacter sp. AP-Melu-500A-A1]|uniref:acetate--CoA ligase family protein n=1 Tax=Polynucleobacter sp. AP-Melu-500A-A1 TaxID=2576929 RepID=UPI001C0C32C7|nr:acetate--CoA ligase [Polynucleobacter sp. AP-Melu-500A-A1]MBU3631416.1 acetate--CoA ligase family protein [Polynucleobacter sp. AP-Melu-500A-A1]